MLGNGLRQGEWGGAEEGSRDAEGVEGQASFCIIPCSEPSPEWCCPGDFSGAVSYICPAKVTVRQNKGIGTLSQK